jgi:hypothetical protein
MAANQIIIDVKIGPLVNAIADLLSSAQECSEIIPDWYPEEKERLNERTQRLFELVSEQIKEMRDP